MKTTKTQSSVPSFLNVRLIFLAACAVVILLELSFLFFHVLKRPLMPGFDMMATLCIPILLVAIKIFFPNQWRLDFGSTSLPYRFFVVVAGFVLLIKTLYFLAYLAAFLFKHHS